ncbi:UNVERIFIED_CONTAM: hypothetical protein Q9R58_25130 [Methylobacteriaceae bacterium AG10]|uniref:hypothetical protein n=1 Tax=Methylobacterium fujisawaense TaxID=107400 RepID=UPI002938168F|nr:hypothetical protein [Methylobacteriaceae bacterium AG10]
MARLIVSQPFERLARFLNEHTVCRARRFVYAMSDGHLDFVQAHMGKADEHSIADRVTRFQSAGEMRRHKQVFNPPWANRRRR